MNNNKLSLYGLTNSIEEQGKQYEGLYIARVLEQHNNIYTVLSEEKQLYANVSGSMKYEASDSLQLPAVGDWVMIDRLTDKNGNAIIHKILNRKSILQRKAAGNTQMAQVIATNIDIVFICMALNLDFNIRRLERYISIAWDSGATPVIILTKADLCDDLADKLEKVKEVSIGIDIITSSVLEENSYEKISSYIKEGITVVFVGSSGVGKSTIVNHLMGKDILKTNILRNDDKGLHTTTSRQMFLLPNGGVVIDTPGMRELHVQLTDLSKSFQDIERLKQECKFNDCSHNNEPGCAVKKAVQTGELTVERLESYRKLQKESNYENLTSKQIEQKKIESMFGGKNQMKNFIKQFKNKK